MIVNQRPRFYLKRPGANGPTGIFMVIHVDRKQRKWGTGKSIHPELWDKEKQQPTTNRHKIAKAKKINPSVKADLQNIKTRLDNITVEVAKVLAYQETQGITPTIELIKDHLDAIFGTGAKNPKATTTTLLEYTTLFVDQIESGERLIPSTSKQYKFGTVKNYKGFLAQLTSYQKKKKKILLFEDVTMDFYDSFVKFFNNKNYSANTTGRHIRHLKAIMAAAKEERLHNVSEFERKAFKTIKVEVDEIYLTESELKRIENKDLSKTPKLDIARDIFLVGCYTAQRFSDYSRISADHVTETEDGSPIIKLIQNKTGATVMIPISPKLLAILVKYNYQLPKTFEQKINKRIKDVAELAGINSVVITKHTQGGKVITKKSFKYDKVKTHTARRTGATLMYLANIPLIDIMKITGHTTTKNLLRYIKVSKEQTANKLSVHPYFNQSPLKIAK